MGVKGLEKASGISTLSSTGAGTLSSFLIVGKAENVDLGAGCYIDREAWRVAVHGVAKNWTQLSNRTELVYRVDDGKMNELLMITSVFLNEE